MAEEGIELLAEHMRAPHYVDGDSHFVRTLLKAYEEYTGLKGSCQYTGGGTYVHSLKNGMVAFGLLQCLEQITVCMVQTSLQL